MYNVIYSPSLSAEVPILPSSALRREKPSPLFLPFSSPERLLSSPPSRRIYQQGLATLTQKYTWRCSRSRRNREATSEGCSVARNVTTLPRINSRRGRERKTRRREEPLLTLLKVIIMPADGSYPSLSIALSL